MNDPVATYVYWYYLGGVVLLALVTAAFCKWYRCSKQK